MPLSLDDFLNLPSQPSDEHLTALGLLRPPAPPPPPIALKPMSPVAPEIKPMSKLGHDLAEHATNTPHLPAIAAPTETAGPEMNIASPDANVVAPMKPPVMPTEKESVAAGISEHGGTEGEEGRRQYQELRPKIDAPVGSSAYWQQKLAQSEFDKTHPWGGDISAHPGTLGKIGHVLAKIGNVAGEIVAPATLANIPGTELNREVQDATARRQLGEAQTRETAAATDTTREKHEENVSQLNQDKLEQADKKLAEEQKKHLSDREIALRKQGLKPDAANPQGPPIPLTREDMSEAEQASLDVKGAIAESHNAKAALDKVRADPNSPQSKAALERVQVMAKNAATAAGKLGLDQKKFAADYFGIDLDTGKPLAGTMKDESGAPVGPRVANSGKAALASLNKDYVKPANDVEKSYQMMNNAYHDYKAAAAKGQELPTGAESMLALSTHLATTFGNVKGARVTKDMIEHHLGARSIPDSALVAVQRLTNGDVLSPDQWEAFHHLIGESRKLSWQTATKEAKRANLPVDFLPEDLKEQQAPAAKAAGAPEGGKKPLPF